MSTMCRERVLAAALVAAALAAVTAADHSHSRESSKLEGSHSLIKTLRKQLTRDNSDYTQETPKQTGTAHARAKPELDTLQQKYIDNNDYVTRIYQQRDYEANSKTKDNAEENGSMQKPEHPVSEKDLLYYIDDEKLISKKPGGRKYKTLKVRHQYRRTGNSGNSQYIQEEGEEGVAIVSLSGAPFPELRLPHSRRQYKHDRGAASTADEELPPPPAADDWDQPSHTAHVEESTATVLQNGGERQLSF